MADKKTEEIVDETIDELAQAAPEEVVETSISLADLGAVIKIIDVVTKRGAFNGDELADVGAVRNRLQAFVTASTPPPADTDTK
mgnify:CR=1 FL=1|tara:strand:+ start:543 stop:794 length:252 start_codon:yes stop_codon:yes gene_type:complete